tara:strand:- start:6011 stop:6121 length:111 start_codon:yes stop_codon:yes gene_type:complete
MEVILEWEGLSGVLKILFFFSLPLFIGFFIGRRTKK